MLRQSCLHPVRLLTRTDAELCSLFHSFFLVEYLPNEVDTRVLARFPQEKAQIDTIESGLKLFLLDQILHADLTQENSGKFVITSSDCTRYFAFFRSYACRIFVAVSQLPLLSFSRDVLQLLGREQQQHIPALLLALSEIPVFPAAGMHYELQFSSQRSATLKFNGIEQVEDIDIDFLAMSVLTPMMLVRAWEAIILERKVLVVSECDSLVIACCEFLRRLALPLVIVNTYVPLLPLQLIDAIDAPFPYLLGANLCALREHGLDLSGTCVVDIDAKVVLPAQKDGNNNSNNNSGGDIAQSEQEQKFHASDEMISNLVQEVNAIMVHPLANWFSRPSSSRLPLFNRSCSSKDAYVARAAQVVQVFILTNLNLIGARFCTVKAFWRDPSDFDNNNSSNSNNSGSSSNGGGKNSARAVSNQQQQQQSYNRYSGNNSSGCSSNRSAVNSGGASGQFDGGSATTAAAATSTAVAAASQQQQQQQQQRRTFDSLGYHFQRGVISGFAQLSKDVHRDVHSLTEFTPCWVEMDYGTFAVYVFADDAPVIYFANRDVETVSPCPAEPEGHVLELVVKDQSSFRLTMTDAQSRQRWIAAIDRRRQQQFKWESEALIEERINESIELAERRPDYLGGGYYASAFRQSGNGAAAARSHPFDGVASAFSKRTANSSEQQQQQQQQQQSVGSQFFGRVLHSSRSEQSMQQSPASAVSRFASLTNAHHGDSTIGSDMNSINSNSSHLYTNSTSAAAASSGNSDTADFYEEEVVGDELLSGDNGAVDPYRYGSATALGLSPSLRSAHYLRQSDKADSDFRYMFSRTQMMAWLHSHLECADYSRMFKEQHVKTAMRNSGVFATAAAVTATTAVADDDAVGIEEKISLLIKHARSVLGMDATVCVALRQLQNEITTLLGEHQANALRESALQLQLHSATIADGVSNRRSNTTAVAATTGIDAASVDQVGTSVAAGAAGDDSKRSADEKRLRKKVVSSLSPSSSSSAAAAAEKELRRSIRIDSTNLNIPPRFSRSLTALRKAMPLNEATAVAAADDNYSPTAASNRNAVRFTSSSAVKLSSIDTATNETAADSNDFNARETLCEDDGENDDDITTDIDTTAVADVVAAAAVLAVGNDNTDGVEVETEVASEQPLRTRNRFYRALFPRRSSNNNSSNNNSKTDASTASTTSNAEQRSREQQIQEAVNVQQHLKQQQQKQRGDKTNRGNNNSNNNSHGNKNSSSDENAQTREQLVGALHAMLYFITSTHRRLQAELNTFIVDERMRALKGAADAYNESLLDGRRCRRIRDLYTVKFDIRQLADCVKPPPNKTTAAAEELVIKNQPATTAATTAAHAPAITTTTYTADDAADSCSDSDNECEPVLWYDHLWRAASLQRSNCNSRPSSIVITEPHSINTTTTATTSATTTVNNINTTTVVAAVGDNAATVADDEQENDSSAVNLSLPEMDELVDEHQKLQQESLLRKDIRKHLLESIRTAHQSNVQRYSATGECTSSSAISHALMGHLNEALGQQVEAIKNYTTGCLADQSRLMSCLLQHYLHRTAAASTAANASAVGTTIAAIDVATTPTTATAATAAAATGVLNDSIEFVRWAQGISPLAGMQAFRLQLELMYRELLLILQIDEKLGQLAKDQELGSFRMFPGSCRAPGLAAQRSEKVNTRSRYATLTNADFSWKSNNNISSSSNSIAASDVLNEAVICTQLHVQRTACQLSVQLLSRLREILKTYCKSPAGSKLCRKSPSGLTKLKIVPAMMEALAASSAFKAFQLHCSMLQMIEVDGMSIDERLLFFCNIYNIIIVHAIIVRGSPGATLLERSTFMRSAKYNIAGSVYTLIDIEHGILRHSSTKAMIFGPLTISITFPERDPRRKMVLEEPRPNVTFCLFTASVNSPSLVVLKDPRSVNEELRKYARRFFHEHVKLLDPSSRSIALPAVLKIYWADFGGTRAKVLKVISQLSGSQFAASLKPYCSSSSTSNSSSNGGESGKPKVEFAPLDWTPMIVLHDV